MKLDNQALYELLVHKGVNSFNHANSVATSITYIENGGLLARGDIERLGLFQTKQASDAADNEFGVWSDIFIDTVDLHGFFPRQNIYGPVLFKFKIDFLLESKLDVWVTKNNPIYWSASTSIEERYFSSVEELSEKWNQFETQRKMFTIRNPGIPVLFDSLESIILDRPGVLIHKTIDLENEALSALSNALKKHPVLMNPVSIRTCANCFCEDNYLKQVSPTELSKLFLPNNHEKFTNM